MKELTEVLDESRTSPLAVHVLHGFRHNTDQDFVPRSQDTVTLSIDLVVLSTLTNLLHKRNVYLVGTILA